MSSSQAIDHNQQKEEEKNTNSLFQTELANPKITTSEQNENKKGDEKNDNNTTTAKENTEDDNLKKEKSKNEDEKDENNNNASQETKIESNLIKDAITISNNVNSEDKNTEQNSNQESLLSKNEEDLNQTDQNQDLTEVVISIDTQLIQNDDKPSPKPTKKENRAKTSNSNRNKNKRYSYLQEINSIPDSVKYNKYIENRYELHTGVKKAPKIPKAAMSKKDYNAKEATQLDELTLKLLNGDEEMIKRIKNSRNIDPNLNDTTKKPTTNVNTKTINNKSIKQKKANTLEKPVEKADNNNPDEKNINDGQTEVPNNNENNGEILDNEDNEQNNIIGEDTINEEEENKENRSGHEEDENNDNDDEENLPTLEDLKRTAGQLREYEREMISKGNYADAKNASNTLKMVNKEIYKKQSFAKNKGSIEQLVSKRNELKALLNSTTEEFDNMLIDHEQNTISKLDEIALQQQQELEEFDKNIPKDLPPLFKRNSVSYLKMRSKEKYLAITRNFDEAMNLQKKADVIEKEEEQLNFEKMDSYYRDKRKKLILKQRNAIENYIQYSDMRKGEMLNLREVAIRGTTNRIKNLETQIRIECNKRGIKQSEINYDLVDNERIELIKSKENENPISYKRAANSKLQRRSQHNSTAATSASLSKRNSVTNSQSSLSSINSQSKRKSSLSSNKPRIKTPSSLSNSPLSSSVGSKRPTKPKKTAINIIQNDKKSISPLNKDSLQDIEKVNSEEIENNNQNEEIESTNQKVEIVNTDQKEEIKNTSQKAEIGVNAKLEDELKINAQILNSEINEQSPKKD